MRNNLLTWTCGFMSLLHTYEALVGTSTIYVPEEHFLFLVCRHGSDVEWTHGVTLINTTKYRRGVFSLDHNKYQLLSDGTLFIRDLEEVDSGLYYCNGQLVAEVTVLTGSHFVVPEGSTLYLPCSFSGKPRQRWAYRHRADSKKEYISTMFKNRTVIQEREDPDSRFIHTYNHLLIINLQLSDSGIYLCNNHDIATVMVIHTERATIPTPTSDVGDNTPQKPENVTLVIFLVISVLAVVVVTLLSVILCLKFGSRKKQPASKQDETELQLKKASKQDPNRSPGDKEHSVPLTDHTEVQYASLGRQNWKTNGWTRDSRQQVIYSTLMLGPTSPLPTTSVTQRV